MAQKAAIAVLNKLYRNAKSKKDLGLRDLERSPEEAVAKIVKQQFEHNTKKYMAGQDKKFVG